MIKRILSHDIFRRIPFKRIPGTPRLWLMLFLSSMLLFGFFEVVDDVFQDPTEGDYESHELDTAVAQYFQQFRSERLTSVARDFTSLGSVTLLSIFSILAFGAVLGKRDLLGFFHLSISLAGAVVWPLLLKSYFGRGRPELVDHLVVVTDLSFPSGHSFGAAVAYATFAFFGARYIRVMRAEVLCYVFALLIMILVGLSRIYLGVHYASDVMAGLTAGGAWAFLVAAGFSLLYQREKQPERAISRMVEAGSPF